MRRWFLILGLVSCAPSRVDWSGDFRFTAEERAQIEAGEAWLAEHANRPVASFDWTYDVTSAQPLPKTIRRERGLHGDGTTTGLCLDRTTIYLDPDDPNAAPGTLDGLAAHELAHCELGFVDDPMTDGIMRVISPKRWTAREEEQCHVTTACAPK